MHEDERKVLEALKDPHWDWRTLPGLERTTGLPRSAILEVLFAHYPEVEAEPFPKYGTVFRLKGREHQRSLLEKTLDYISLGAR